MEGGGSAAPKAAPGLSASPPQHSHHGHSHSHGEHDCTGRHSHGSSADDHYHDRLSEEDEDEDKNEVDLERAHFLDCVRALLDYKPHMVAQLRTRLQHFEKLPADHRARFPGGPDGMKQHILEMLKGVRANAKFLTYVATHDSYAHASNNVTERTVDDLVDQAWDDFDPQTPDSVVLAAPHNPLVRSKMSHMSKVRSSLRQLVRDWTREGQEERDQCYGPIIAEMKRVLPITHENRNKLMVFLPGSGLSRLMVDLCACVRVDVYC